MMRFLFVPVIFLLTTTSLSQKINDPVRVDKNGRLIWTRTNTEAMFWGVNYSIPFAHGYRQMERLNKNIEENIDIDVYHMARIGVTAYRIHVWACEISDPAGNLISNEHLRLLDYLINRLRERGIYTLLTPIRYGSPGYPEPDVNDIGFADDYPKSSMYLIPEAIAAQENYLKQFVSHVNPYTGFSYKNDPMIIGFEICNEPAHSKPAETTFFVRKMINAVRSSGCTKPVFYNVTQNIRLLEDFIKGKTDGATFQWYPSGLVANHEQPGNFLPHVDVYAMPFKNEKYFRSQARIVYEFDAADVGRSYLYPAMALSFKEAGMQWATMFAYDAMALAPSNTEYQTHFLNLIYSPQKAVSFMIAGELFRNPRYRRERSEERHPFDIEGLEISYEKDYSELITKELFYYSGNTSTIPEDRSTLKSIAGYGSSSLVLYNGRGAYFLDKVKDGLWRLEVMPDALWVRDPFSKATPSIQNVVIKWQKHNMKVDLPDLGGSFIVKGINDGNIINSVASDGDFVVSPGTYFLSKSAVTDKPGNTYIGVIKATEYYAPPSTDSGFYFGQQAPEQVSESQLVNIDINIISPSQKINRVLVQPFTRGYRGAIIPYPAPLPAIRIDDYQYRAILPDSIIRPGFLTYHILLENEDGSIKVYPGGLDGPVTRWDFSSQLQYSIRVLPSGSEIELFNAEENEHALFYSGKQNITTKVIPSGIKGVSCLKVFSDSGVSGDIREEKSGMLYVMQNHIGDIMNGIGNVTGNLSSIVIRAKSVADPVKIKVSLITGNGHSYSAATYLKKDIDLVTLDLNKFGADSMFLLPRSYPVFQPYWFRAATDEKFSLKEIERIQFLVPSAGNEAFKGLEISSVTLK